MSCNAAGSTYGLLIALLVFRPGFTRDRAVALGASGKVEGLRRQRGIVKHTALHSEVYGAVGADNSLWGSQEDTRPSGHAGPGNGSQDPVNIWPGLSHVSVGSGFIKLERST